LAANAKSKILCRYVRFQPGLMMLRVVAALLTIASLSACCDEAGIPKRIQGLYSSEAKTRNDSALALARCGSAGRGAVSRLADLLYDPNVGVQSASAYALRKIDTPDARQYLAAAEDRRRARKK
jgi:HEAT repeat protein